MTVAHVTCTLLKIKTNLKFWAIFLIYLLYIRTSSCNITLSLISWFTCVLFVRQIKAPVLLMLGGRDRRVSPHQGLELYKVLKSRASPVRYSKCSGIQKNLVFCFNCSKVLSIVHIVFDSNLLQVVVVCWRRTFSVQSGHAGQLLPKHSAVVVPASLNTHSHTNITNKHILYNKNTN